MPTAKFLRDIVEEHLDEAAFQWRQWSLAFGSATLTAADLAEGIEERLLASVDALAVAAPTAGTRLLEPALCEGEPGAAFAAALALLTLPNGFLAIRRALAGEDDTARRAALQQALALSPRQGLEREVEPLLSPEHPAGAAAALGVFAARRLDPGPRLLDLIASGDAEMAAAALRAAPWCSRPTRAAVERAYAFPVPAVRDAALEVGLFLGLGSALAASRKLAASRAPSPVALMALAMSGTASDLQLLTGALEEPLLRRAALRALGFAGSPRAVDRILPWLAEPSTACAAGEAFAAITGIAIDGDSASQRGEEKVSDEGALRSDLLPGRILSGQKPCGLSTTARRMPPTAPSSAIATAATVGRLRSRRRSP